MIIYENNYAIVDEIKFKKDANTGYYLSTKKIGNSRIRLHRYIWQKYNGEIPKGYDIHHIDHNKDNNEINNLELLVREEHKARHGHELSDEMREFYRKNLNEKARPKASEWHKSKEGREWHKEQYKKTLGKIFNSENYKTFKCENCGKEFKTIHNGKNRFCSNNCKSAFRRKSGVDDVERVCIKCGRKFKANKYTKRKSCDNCKGRWN